MQKLAFDIYLVAFISLLVLSLIIYKHRFFINKNSAMAIAATLGDIPSKNNEFIVCEDDLIVPNTVDIKPMVPSK